MTGDGQHLTVMGGATATAAITDTYTLTGSSLTVTKTIAGPAAGQQGPVNVEVVCGGTALTPDLVVPPGTAAGTTSHTYDDVPGGSTCQVSEMVNGATNAVSVTTVGSDQKVILAAGNAAQVGITNVYQLRPGDLTVTKTIAGPAAGLQAPIQILADCGGDNIFGMHIDARTAAGPVPEVFYDIPAGSECKVVEIHDGHSETVAVVGVGGGQKVTVPPGGHATADLTDTFTAVEAPTTTTTVPVTTTTTPHVTTTTSAHVTSTTTAVVTSTTSSSNVTTTTSSHATTSTSSAVVTPTTSAVTSTTSSVATTTPSQGVSTTVGPVTSTTSSSSVTLPETGAGAATPLLVEVALAVMAAGGVIAAIAGRRRHPRATGRQPKE